MTQSPLAHLGKGNKGTREEGQKPIQFCLKLPQEEDWALLAAGPLLAHRLLQFRWESRATPGIPVLGKECFSSARSTALALRTMPI